MNLPAHPSASFIKRNPSIYDHPPDCPLQDPEPQRDQTPALGKAVLGKEKSLDRVTMGFVGFRVRPLDPDNFAGSIKDLLDGLRHAGLLLGDEWWRIRLETEQVKVQHRKDERTEITITYPMNIIDEIADERDRLREENVKLKQALLDAKRDFDAVGWKAQLEETESLYKSAAYGRDKWIAQLEQAQALAKQLAGALEVIRAYINQAAHDADKSSHEWEKTSETNAAYRSGMWYAYNDIRNMLPVT